MMLLNSHLMKNQVSLNSHLMKNQKTPRRLQGIGGKGRSPRSRLRMSLMIVSCAVNYVYTLFSAMSVSLLFLQRGVCVSALHVCGVVVLLVWGGCPGGETLLNSFFGQTGNPLQNFTDDFLKH